MSSSCKVFVTVRTESSRLPRKCFLPFGEGSVLDHIISRCFQYDLSPIVCTTNETRDDEIVTLAKKWTVPFLRGPTINKLLRWHLCCKFFNLDAFHSVDADDPFFCGDEVKRSLALLREGYDMVAPTQSSSAGGASRTKPVGARSRIA